MDPFTIAVAGIGLATSIFGGVKSSQDASFYAKQQNALVERSNEVSTDKIQQEENINDQHRQQMELQANRAQMENIRNTQRARAMGINAAVNQGGTFGSGMAGGVAEGAGQGLLQGLGIQQNLDIGRNIFAFNDKVSQDNIQLGSLNAQEQTLKNNFSAQQATDNAISNLGGSLMKSANPLGAMFKGLGGGFGGGGSSGSWGGDPGASNTGGIY